MSLVRSVQRIFWPLFAVLYGLVMLWVAGSIPGQLIGPSKIHRLQAEAILDGRFHLAESITQLDQGLAWHDGRVQQVWGLGVGLWLAPVQWAWRLIGETGEFPDRIALGIAFALQAGYCGATASRLSRSGKWAEAIGLLWLVLGSPPLWTLTRSAQTVFEETVLYGLLVALGLFLVVVRCALWKERKDLWIACILAASCGFFRPTLLVYGIVAVALCGWRLRRFSKEVLSVAAIMAASLALLGWSNAHRFGSSLEFGHRLTVTGGSMVCLTRFESPYVKAGTKEATKELFGALFLANELKDAGAFSEDQFAGQSQETRWRRLNFTVFHWSHLVVGLASVLGTAWVWRKTGQEPVPSGIHSSGYLLVWSWVSLAALGAFYLRYPVISSRYLVDFLPAVTGIIAAGWLAVARRAPRISLSLLCLWTLGMFVHAQSPMGSSGKLPGELGEAYGLALGRFEGTYTAHQHPSYTGINWNGYGWEEQTGLAHNVVILAIDDPQFVELGLASAGNDDSYQAVMDGQPLSVEAVEDDGTQRNVRFKIPESILKRPGEQVLFLCFSADFNETNQRSRRILQSVRWK